MFSLKEYYKILEKDPIKAKEYCLMFSGDLCANCERILLNISYLNEGRLEDNVNELEQYFLKLNNSEYKDRIRAILANLKYELKDYKKSLKYCNDLVKEPNDDNILCLYYLCKIALREDANDSIEELENLFFSSDKLAPFFINESLNAIGTYFFDNEEFDSGDAFFNKCYLLLTDKEPVARLHMLLLTYYTPENNDKLKETFNTWKRFAKQDLHYLFFSDLIQGYDLACNAPVLAKELYEEFENDNGPKDISQSLINKAIIEFYNCNYKLSYDTFKSISKELLFDNYCALYTFGLSILYLDDRRLFHEGIEALEIIKNSNSSFAQLAISVQKYLYLAIHDYDKVEQIMDADKNEFDYELKSLCLSSKGKFDAANKVLKKYYKETKKTSYRYPFCAIDNDEISNKVFMGYQSGNSAEDYRQKAMMHFHGFGVAKEVNASLALEYALKAYEMEPDRNCHGSVLGNIYLSMEEYEKAFNIFKEGYDNYANYKENCACSLGFYCYCLMNGYGCDKDEEKAYNILSNFDFKAASDLIIYDYAYLCLKRKENLKRAYELLLTVNEWRYDVGKYYLLIKVAKELSIDSKEYEVKYKENLRHSPIREQEHYKNNPVMFYLTNI